MRGRKPTPTRLKIVRGNPGRRQINRHEPAPKVAVPQCPDHLDEIGKTEWQRMVKQLAPMGLVTLVDRAALAAYCDNWSLWVRAKEKIKASGEILKSKDGNLYQNPYLAVANRAQREMHRFLIEFGMTPSSRSRLSIAPPSAENEFEAFLKRRRSS